MRAHHGGIDGTRSVLYRNGRAVGGLNVFERDEAQGAIAATLEVVVVRRSLFCGSYYWMWMPEMARDDEPLDSRAVLDDGVDHWRIVSFYWSGVLFSKESPHEIRGRTDKRLPGCHHAHLVGVDRV